MWILIILWLFYKEWERSENRRAYYYSEELKEFDAEIKENQKNQYLASDAEVECQRISKLSEENFKRKHSEI